VARWFASLRRSGEIAHVRRRGVRAIVPTLTAFATGDRPGPRVGRVAISIPKAVGSAVVRNRIKRQLKGALDALPAPKSPLRLVVIVKPEAAAEPYARLAADLGAVLRRLPP